MKKFDNAFNFTVALMNGVSEANSEFNFEADGCWAMAQAIYENFSLNGYDAQMRCSIDHSNHAWVRVSGKNFNHQGEMIGKNYSQYLSPKDIRNFYISAGISDLKFNSDLVTARKIVNAAWLSMEPELTTKVIDEDGLHLPVFHGTSFEFQFFKDSPEGIFFAEDRKKAVSFTKVNKGPLPRVIEVELDINNPWEYIYYDDSHPYKDQLIQTKAHLSELGYDGIHMGKEGVWIAFFPEQIEIINSEKVVSETQNSDGVGDFSKPFDFSKDKRFRKIFYENPSSQEISQFSAWLNNNQNLYFRMYHGTSDAHDIKKEGLLPSNTSSRNSSKTECGYVYLSIDSSNALKFGNLSKCDSWSLDGGKTSVYPVTLPLRVLLPDVDQIKSNSQNLGAGTSLVDSVLYGRGVRLSGSILPLNIGKPERYSEGDLLIEHEYRAMADRYT